MDADDRFAEEKRVMDSLEAYVRHLVGESARVERSTYSEGRLSILWVTPHNPKARSFVIVEEQCLQVDVGEHGGYWELDYTSADIEFARITIEAVVNGRAVELIGPGRSDLRLALATGEVVSQTGNSAGLGWLPIPGWRKRAKIVHYEPYSPGSAVD